MTLTDSSPLCLPVTAGSDCHSLHAAARGGIETACPIRTPKELAATLRGGTYRIFTSGK